MELAFELLRAFWFGFWTTIRSVWPTLNTYFDINRKIVIAIIAGILGIILVAVGAPKIIRKIVKHL